MYFDKSIQQHKLEVSSNISDYLEKGGPGSGRKSTGTSKPEPTPAFRYSDDREGFRESVSRMRKMYDNTNTSPEKKAKIKQWMEGAKKHKAKNFK